MALYLGKDLVSASSGLGVTIKNQDKTFTENGSYSADSGYTGLGIVKVDVQPKNQDITVTENGTYTADEGYTGLGTVTVDVPTGGGASVSPKDVNFYDYDGTLLHSYTVEEAQALTELPELPTQKGLICQGWNYDLETIKSYNRAVDVGAMYITDDGKTRLYIRIATEGLMTVPLYFNQTVSNGVTIDWGDGSATETLSGTGKVNTSHTYASIGDYIISLSVAEGCELSLGHNSWNLCVLGAASSSRRTCGILLKKVEIGSGVPYIHHMTFQYCSALTSIVIPNGLSFIGNNSFQNCSALTSIVIPNSVTSIYTQAFQACYALTSIVIPNSVTSIGVAALCYVYCSQNIVIPNSVTSIYTQAFQACYALTSIVIPNSVTSIGSDAFANCVNIAFYDFTSHTSVPSLANTSAFNGIATDCQIRVPAALYDEWIVATNWSNFASNIVAV